MRASSTEAERKQIAKTIVAELKRAAGKNFRKPKPEHRERYVNFIANTYCMQTIKLKQSINEPWTKQDAERDLASIQALMDEVFTELLRENSSSTQAPQHR